MFDKNISLNDKINHALQLLKKTVSNTKKTLGNIYYIHRPVELKGYRIGWQCPQDTIKQFSKVINKYFTTNPSYAASKEYYLLKQISNKKILIMPFTCITII